ncbi:MAG: ribosomal protein [Acidobacteriota bacterium]|jgi:large subunit ribosomal protein L29
MKRTAKQALEGLSVAELESKVREGAEQMFRIKFQMSMGQGEGLKKYRELRKERAVLLTLRREKGATGPVNLGAVAAAPAPAAKTKKPRAKKA